MPGIGISIDSNQISSVRNQYSISTIIANFGIRTLTTLKNLLNITLYSIDCHINVPKYQYRYRNIGISIQILGIGISIGIDSIKFQVSVSVSIQIKFQVSVSVSIQIKFQDRYRFKSNFRYRYWFKSNFRYQFKFWYRNISIYIQAVISY